MVRRHESGRRGTRARKNFYKVVKNITEEEAIQKFRDKQKRLAEKLGWEDNWHKQKSDLGKKQSHKSRVVHSGHGD